MFSFLFYKLILRVNTNISTLENIHFPENLHLNCRKTCRSYFSESLQTKDSSLNCNLECENLNPISLSQYTNKVIKNIIK